MNYGHINNPLCKDPITHTLLPHYLELVHDDQELLEWHQKFDVQCSESSLSSVPPSQSCEQNRSQKFCSGMPPKSEREHCHCRSRYNFHSFFFNWLKYEKFKSIITQLTNVITLPV